MKAYVHWLGGRSECVKLRARRFKRPPDAHRGDLLCPVEVKVWDTWRCVRIRDGVLFIRWRDAEVPVGLVGRWHEPTNGKPPRKRIIPIQAAQTRNATKL